MWLLNKGKVANNSYCLPFLAADSSACSSLGVTGPSIEDEYVTMQSKKLIVIDMR